MDHDMTNLDVRVGRKMSCSLQFALRLTGSPYHEPVPGGLEFAHYESYDLYLNYLARIFKTITISPQYRISKKSRVFDTVEGDPIVETSRWPDFAIIRTLSERIRPGDEESDWIFQERTVLAVVEIKPLCGVILPNFTEEQVVKALLRALMAADAQAKTQAKYVFATKPKQNFVFAIIGSGPYWRYTVYERSQMTPLRSANQDEDDYAEFDLEVTENPLISPVQKLGTRRSSGQFINMMNLMKQKFQIPDNDW